MSLLPWAAISSIYSTGEIAKRPLLFASASQHYDLGWVMRSLRPSFYAIDSGTVTINFVFLKDPPGIF